MGVGQLKLRSLFLWFKEREDVENELKVSRSGLTLEDPQLAAVRRAVAGMLPGFSGLRIQRDPLHMIVRKGDTQLAIDQLSDGEKLTLGLAADLARRLAITYAGHPDPLAGEAVVLIDAGRYDEAQSQLDALAKVLTERDREIVGLRTMLHFLEGGDATDPQGA